MTNNIFESTRKYDSLWHHGIKGMKWGIRRYQYEDGTLTPAGRKRYDGALRETDRILRDIENDYGNAVKRTHNERIVKRKYEDETHKLTDKQQRKLVKEAEKVRKETHKQEERQYDEYRKMIRDGQDLDFVDRLWNQTRRRYDTYMATRMMLKVSKLPLESQHAGQVFVANYIGRLSEYLD